MNEYLALELIRQRSAERRDEARKAGLARTLRQGLNLLGIDHTKLTYRYAGRDFRLTDVAGQVVRGVLA